MRDLYAESSSLTSGLRISDRTIADLILELSKVGHSVAALAENVQTCDSKIHELDSTWPKLPCFKESMGAPDLAHSASDVQPAQSGAKVKSRFSAAVGH